MQRPTNKRRPHVQLTRDKFLNRIHPMVLHHVPTDTQTDIQPRGIPQPSITQRLHSTGKLLSAIGLGAVVLAATASSAGAYTAGSADYGQVITQLQDANQTLTTSSNELYNQEQNIIKLTNYNQALQIWTNTPATATASENPEAQPGSAIQAVQAELGPYDTNGPPGLTAPSYLSIGSGESMFWSGSTLDWNVNGQPSEGPTSVFQWYPNGQTNPTPQGVFNDTNGYSVFQSPGGNSYTSWLPGATSDTSGQGTTGWQAAAASTVRPYSVFKDAYGYSDFAGAFGHSYLADVELTPNTTGVNTEQESVFKWGTPNGVQDSVFKYTSYNPVTGNNVNPDGTSRQDISVFTAATGANSGNPNGHGSVFITDDPTNKNIGNSVFLDIQGNSYLDDITADLNISAQNLSPQGPMHFGTTPQLTYNQLGQVIINTPNNNDEFANYTPALPISITQLFAAASGITNQASSGSSTFTTPGYLAETLNALTMSNGETPFDWYQSAGANVDNAFAQAFFNPPAYSDTTLTPYLSAFQGWKDSTAQQTQFTTSQQQLQDTITTETTAMDNEAQGTNGPSAGPTATTPTADLQGNYADSVWQMPVNEISQDFGVLTDSNTGDAAAINDQGYVGDNKSTAILGAFASVLGLVNPNNSTEVPTAETTTATAGDSTLTQAQLKPVSVDDFGQGTSASGFITAGPATTLPANWSDTAGTTATTQGAKVTETMDVTDGAISAYMVGFVDGLQWFRGQFAWMAQLMGLLLELFCVIQCWHLIVWGFSGGPFPIDLTLRKPVPKHDTVSDPAGRDSPLNAADNYQRVATENAPMKTGTERATIKSCGREKRGGVT